MATVGAPGVRSIGKTGRRQRKAVAGKVDEGRKGDEREPADRAGRARRSREGPAARTPRARATPAICAASAASVVPRSRRADAEEKGHDAVAEPVDPGEQETVERREVERARSDEAGRTVSTWPASQTDWAASISMAARKQTVPAAHEAQKRVLAIVLAGSRSVASSPKTKRDEESPAASSIAPERSERIRPTGCRPERLPALRRRCPRP